MIKAIYFDFDGVLTLDTNDGYTTCKNLAARTDIDFDTLYNAYSPFLEKLYAGICTNRDIWEDFCTSLNTSLDFSMLESCFVQTPKNESMYEIVTAVRKKGYITGVITNQTVWRYELLRNEFELDLFDPVVVSASVSCTKRAPYGGEKIFNVAMATHNLAPEECVFIDNSKSNLVIPTAMGFHTFHHDDSKNDTKLFLDWLATLQVSLR